MPRRTSKTGNLNKDLIVSASERRSWWVERATWIGMLMIVIVALSGGLGVGGFSHAIVTTLPLTVHYDRILRSDSPSTITVRAVATDTMLQVELDSILSGVHTTTFFSPTPDGMSPTTAGSIATWRVNPGDSVSIVAVSTVHGIGRHIARLRRVPGEWIALTLTVLP
ncbi:MAG: hypothetical protein ABIR59_10930 [Gemmatimonadales bacterium]